MNTIKTIFYIFVAGALGGITSGLLVWALGAIGVTPASGFNMAPKFTLDWISGRTLASGIWGIIFLIPIYQKSPFRKGAVLGILPWLSSVLIVFPNKMNIGFFGLELGLGTPVWTLFFGVVWGITGTLFLAKFHTNKNVPVDLVDPNS